MRAKTENINLIISFFEFQGDYLIIHGRRVKSKSERWVKIRVPKFEDYMIEHMGNVAMKKLHSRITKIQARIDSIKETK